MTGRDLDGLLAEAEAAPIQGWDFSWLDGRPTEERPAWGYSSMATRRVRRGARAVLDIQTGGGEVFEGILAAGRPHARAPGRDRVVGTERRRRPSPARTPGRDRCRGGRRWRPPVPRRVVRPRPQPSSDPLELAGDHAQSLRVEFFDVGAVVYFLRLVIWTVPDFRVARYRDRLAALQRQIDEEGAFVCHAQRLLFEAVRPERAGEGS
jgi:hypothetical protein